MIASDIIDAVRWSGVLITWATCAYVVFRAWKGTL